MICLSKSGRLLFNAAITVKTALFKGCNHTSERANLLGFAEPPRASGGQVLLTLGSLLFILPRLSSPSLPLGSWADSLVSRLRNVDGCGKQLPLCFSANYTRAGPQHCGGPAILALPAAFSKTLSGQVDAFTFSTKTGHSNSSP